MSSPHRKLLYAVPALRGASAHCCLVPLRSASLVVLLDAPGLHRLSTCKCLMCVYGARMHRPNRPCEARTDVPLYRTVCCCCCTGSFARLVFVVTKLGRVFVAACPISSNRQENCSETTLSHLRLLLYSAPVCALLHSTSSSIYLTAVFYCFLHSVAAVFVLAWYAKSPIDGVHNMSRCEKLGVMRLELPFPTNPIARHHVISLVCRTSGRGGIFVPAPNAP